MTAGQPCCCMIGCVGMFSLSALAHRGSRHAREILEHCGQSALHPLPVMSKEQKIRLLFCTNDRGEGRRSCGGSGANALRKYAKEKAATYPNLKVKKSGCLGHCKHGPVIQILPEKALYRCIDIADVDRLFAQRIDADDAATDLSIARPKKAKKR